MSFMQFSVICAIVLGAEATPPTEPVPAGGGAVLVPINSDLSDDIVQSFKETLATPPAETPKGETIALDVRMAVDLAVLQHAQALVAEDDAAAARARVGQARSQLFPQIDASSTFTATDFNEPDDSDSGLLGLIGPNSGAGLVFKKLIGTDRLFETHDTFRNDRIGLRQVIYSGGQIRAAIRASQYLAESQEFQQDAILAQLEFEAKEAYYIAAASQALVRVAEQSVETYERQLADTKQKFEAGTVSNFELLRTGTELGSRQSDLTQAHNAQRLAYAVLCRALGLPQDTPLSLEASFEYVPSTEDLDTLVAYADEHRPEILALEKGIAAGEQELKRVKGQYRPSVAGNVEWRNNDHGGVTNPDGFTVSVGAQWDIFTGGRRKYERIETKAQLSGLEHQLQDLEALVELDVKATQIQIQDALAVVVSERDTRDLAREGLRLAEIRYLEGAGTVSETLDAELALTSAENGLVQALRDLAIANSALERAIGKSWVVNKAAASTSDSAVSVTPAEDTTGQ
jgi:outer membrane protein